jgi:hypothetical protein
MSRERKTLSKAFKTIQRDKLLRKNGNYQVILFQKVVVKAEVEN